MRRSAVTGAFALVFILISAVAGSAFAQAGDSTAVSPLPAVDSAGVSPLPALDSTAVSPATVPAEAVSDRPEDRCSDFYRKGEYERAVDCLNSVLYTGEIKDTARLLTCYEFLGAALTMIDKRDLAKAAFKKLLSLNPKYELNPNVYLPDIISLYQIARFESLYAYRVLLLDTVPAYSRGYNYLPLAVPQFKNKEKTKAVLVLCLQAVSLGFSVFAYQEEQGYYSPDYGYREENVSDARAWNWTQRISLFTFLSAYVYSMIDGFMNKPITFERAAMKKQLK